MPETPAIRNLKSLTIGHPGVPVAAVAMLAGLSLVTLCAAFTECTYRSMDISPLTFQLSMAAAMFATALGPLVLARVVLSLRSLSLKRSVSNSESASRRVRTTEKRDEDRELRWMVTSIVALVGCVLILATPEVFGWVHQIKTAILGEFLWATLSVSILEGVVLFVIAAAPFSFLGLLIRCVHQVSNCDGRWNIATAAWFLVGAGIASLTVPLIAERLNNDFLLMRLACGPIVLAALISTWQVSRKLVPRDKQSSGDPSEPEFGQRWPTVLRLAVAVMFMSIVCASAVWIYVASAVRFDRDVSLIACSGLFISAAAGIYLASRRARDANDLVGVFGQSAVAAGIVLAGAVAVFNLVLRECAAPFVQSFGFVLLWGVCGCAPVLFAAYAIGIGWVSILRRYVYRGQQGATLLWISFAVVGLTLLFVAPGLMRRLGSFATLIAAALCMVATGGILIIHGPSVRQDYHRARVAGVFAAVLAMMWTMPYFGNGWLSDQQHPRRMIAESTWMSYYFDDSGHKRAIHAGDLSLGRSVKSTPGLMTQPPFALRTTDDVREPRVGVLDLAGAGLELLPPDLSEDADAYSFDLHLRGRISPSSKLASPIRSWPQLRSSYDVYDLLVVSLSDLPPRALRRTINRSFLETTINRLSVDGVLMLLLPMDDTKILNQFGRLASSYDSGQFYCGVTRVESQGRALVSVFLSRGSNGESNVREWSPNLLYKPQVLTNVRPDLTIQLSDASAANPTGPVFAAIE